MTGGDCRQGPQRGLRLILRSIKGPDEQKLIVLGNLLAKTRVVLPSELAPQPLAGASDRPVQSGERQEPAVDFHLWTAPSMLTGAKRLKCKESLLAKAARAPALTITP